MNTSKLSIKKILVFTFIVLLALAYESSVSRFQGYNTILTIVLVVLFIVSFDIKSSSNNTYLWFSLLVLVLVAITSLITNAFYSDTLMFKDVRSISMCVAAMMVGGNCGFSKKEIAVLLTVFGLSSLLVGMEQISSNIGGFVIEDQYLADEKNSLGVLLATTCVSCVFLLLYYHSSSMISVLWGVMALFAMIVLLTIRARADTLTAFLIVLYVFFLKYLRKGWAFFIVAILICLVTYYVLPQTALDYIYNSFFQHFEGRDLTAGRTERNLFTISFLQDHPALGNLKEQVRVPTVHNYVLYKLFCYGFFFAAPLLIYYGYLFFKSAYLSFKKCSAPFYQIGFVLVLIPFVVSFFEYSFPFGPGTATILNFIMLGYSFKSISMSS